LEAQRDAANVLITAKTNSHAESTVGISAGTELLISPTHDVGKILKAVHGVQLVPSSSSDSNTSSSSHPPNDVIAAVSVASLALKHRTNKNGSQRIVLFLGSPMDGVEPKLLQKTGRNLKKNNVHLDVILLGEIEHNEPLLQELVDAANGNNNNNNNNPSTTERTCHLVAVPPGVLPSDVLASSPILGGVGAMMGGGANHPDDAFGAAGGMDFMGGVDPNMDPELAMALRVSMEEERARQERAAAAAAAAAEATTTETQSPPAASVSTMNIMMDEEEALLQQALAMSMNENEPKHTSSTDDNTKQEETQDMEMDEDAAMQMALQMSMQPQNVAEPTGMQDPEFVQQMLLQGTGGDPDDPEIRELLRKAADEKKKKEKQSSDDDDDDDDSDENQKKE
jgi:26S proteasome regulatory subunit N10